MQLFIEEYTSVFFILTVRYSTSFDTVPFNYRFTGFPSFRKMGGGEPIFDRWIDTIGCM
jgi:hypothetical protein